jgi:hypothetical protein
VEKERMHVFARARLVMLMSGLLMALVPMSAQSAGEKPTMTKQTIAVEHIRIESVKSFGDVRAALSRCRAVGLPSRRRLLRRSTRRSI